MLLSLEHYLCGFDKFCVGGVKMVIHDLSVADPFAASF
jgi:hypothetical protein